MKTTFNLLWNWWTNITQNSEWMTTTETLSQNIKYHRKMNSYSHPHFLRKYHLVPELEMGTCSLAGPQHELACLPKSCHINLLKWYPILAIIEKITEILFVSLQYLKFIFKCIHQQKYRRREHMLSNIKLTSVNLRLHLECIDAYNNKNQKQEQI